MKLIENLSDDANQATHVVLDDGSVLTLALYYRPAVMRWQIDLDHPRLVLKGKMLCNHPNLIRQHQHRAGFGLACIMTDGTEPNLVSDFVTGRASLYVLSADEVRTIEADVFGMMGIIV